MEEPPPGQTGVPPRNTPCLQQLNDLGYSPFYTSVTDEEATGQMFQDTTQNNLTDTAENCTNLEMYSTAEQSPCEETGQKVADDQMNFTANGHPPVYTDAPPAYPGPPRIYDPQIIM